MRKPLVAGNWKMHGSKAFVADLLSALQRQDVPCEMAVFSPYLYIPYLSEQLQASALRFGAQNVSQYESGAYTGEISASMLKEFQCDYGLVGHSERRSLFGETNDIVADKFAAVAAAGMIPMLCVGETQAEREANQTESVIKAQLMAVIDKVGIEAFEKAVIAYEPVWAIGTGLTATPEQAQAVHAFIRQLLAGFDATVAENIQILYGGSVKPANANALFAMSDIDGGLVGGASLKADDFLAICQSVEV